MNTAVDPFTNEIIDGLAQATQALDGDVRAAQRAIQETLRHASRIITELRVPK